MGIREMLSSMASARVDGTRSPARNRPSTIAVRYASYTCLYRGVAALRSTAMAGEIPEEVRSIWADHNGYIEQRSTSDRVQPLFGNPLALPVTVRFFPIDQVVISIPVNWLLHSVRLRAYQY